MIRLSHYLRRPRPGNFSVERLYEDVRAKLPADIQSVVCVSQNFSQGILPRITDIVRARAFQGDVNHVTGDVHFLTYLLDPRRTVLTILDCVTLERLTGLKRWLLWLFWYWLPEKRCAAIVVISEATRRQVLRHLNCDPRKVLVIHCNVSEEFRPVPTTFNTSEPRILHIGTAPNKNLLRHAKALEGFRCRFVVIGRLSELQIKTLKQHNISYENYENLSREELLKQYHACDMLLFASTYEGFGLPIVEANAVGRPVVTSNCWSMPEVAGTGACFVDPLDVNSIRAGITRVLEDDTYRECLVENGFQNVRRFSIDKIAEQYASLYRRVNSGRTESNSLK